MAVHSNTGSALSPGWRGLALGGSALSLGKLGLVLGKGHAAISTILALSLGTGLLVTLGGALLLVRMTNFETSDKKKPKAGET